MTKYANFIGVKVPELLLPNKAVDMAKWAVVACDQFTSQPDYWNETEAIVGDAPSALRIMLPELYLDKPDEASRIQAINAHMQQYVQSGVLESKGEGFVYVRRTVDGKARQGLIVALDLENYDYTKGSTTLIRATEGTIVERIPPRLRIRKDAPLEMPHILVLIDDPDKTVIEPLGNALTQTEKLYDFELMQKGGHIEGYLIKEPAQIQAALQALAALVQPAAYEAKYHTGQAPLLFAMGDGNHSFATAKANWERVKQEQGLTGASEHPARYALVELENVHDSGIVFEPIHRVLFNWDDGALCTLKATLAAQNGTCEKFNFASMEALQKETAGKPGHVLPFVTEKGIGCLYVHQPVAQLPVGTLQNGLDAVLKELTGASIDYIHGEDVVMDLGGKPGNIGFFLPPMDKSAFFRTVIFDGALPRKTFSMGEAHEKRYYLECRSIKG
ncbi:MAG: DUF1015 domain-containing protein [Christensenellaceae bacterium]|jgi:hypothetical protein|nr:DUF1015 domain-containing protein [Christensenellaceae bacterium]